MITQSIYTLTNTVFIFNSLISLEKPLKYTKSSVSAPKKYDDHPYHPNKGSTPPPGNNISPYGNTNRRSPVLARFFLRSSLRLQLTAHEREGAYIVKSEVLPPTLEMKICNRITEDLKQLGGERQRKRLLNF